MTRFATVSFLCSAACGGGGVVFGDAGFDAGHASGDASLDGGIHYDCGVFTEDPGWTVAPGFRAVVVADGDDGLLQPVAVSIAGGGFGGKAYLVNAGDGSILAVDTLTGTTVVHAASAGFPTAPALLTTSVWDRDAVFDGQLYIGDQGNDNDGDSRIYRIDPAGAVTLFVQAPGPGLDDIFGMAFSPGGDYPAGLYVTGDTDGQAVDWGVFDHTGTGAGFSELAGAEGIAVDRGGAYGGGLLASRPAGGGYAGDDTVSRVLPNGENGSPVITGLPGVHAVTVAPPGPFGGKLLVASWQSGALLQVDPAGTTVELATGLSLTNYDGNVLEFSPDGRVLFVADRLANRLVCIEPI